LSKHNFEPGVAPGGLQLHLINSSDVTVRRSAFECFAELGDRGLRAFRNCFDCSVRKIPNGSGDSRLPRGSNREIAKPYALNLTNYYESPGYHHCLSTTTTVAATVTAYAAEPGDHRATELIAVPLFQGFGPCNPHPIIIDGAYSCGSRNWSGF
jgi:hypothetical protein